MNLFNTLMQVAKQTGYNTYNKGSNDSGKQQKLRSQLHQCTYADDTKWVIEKAIKQVFHVYPTFETDILSFKQSNQQKRFVQLKAILEIQVRGKNCKVDYNMMIPTTFPKKPPNVRIINRNPDFIVDEFYKSVQSPNDPKSYILNEKLNEIKYWGQDKSIVNVIIQSYDLLRNKFPFAKPTTQPSQNGGMWGSPWQQLNNNNQKSTQNVGQHYNNQSYNNYVNGGGFNSGYNNNVNMGFNNNKFNNNNSNQPPIPFNATNVNQTIVSGQKFVNQTKKSLQQMKIQHIKAIETVQSLDVLKYSIQSQESYLRKSNTEINNFLSLNEQNSSETESLVNLVKPRDELSQQILDLISSIKSREDCSTELESKFNEGDISMDIFLKYVRKIEEIKFEEKVLLAKCISVSHKHH